MRRGLRGAAAAAGLPPVAPPRRLRRRLRPRGRRRRGASPRASGVGRAAGTPALAPRLPPRGSRSRRRAGAGSASCPRHLRAPQATVSATTLARAAAPRPRTRRLLPWSRARGRRSRTPTTGVASRRTRSIERDVSLVLGGRAWVRSALVSPRGDATCSATVITDSKGNRGGMGAWTGRSQRRSWRSFARPLPGHRSRCPRPRRPRRGLGLRLRPQPLRRREPRKQVLGPLAEAGGVLRDVLGRARRAASTARVGSPLPTVRSTLRPRLLHRRLRPVQLRRLAGKVVRGVL